MNSEQNYVAPEVMDLDWNADLGCQCSCSGGTGAGAGGGPSLNP
jgi:hypothetical protein